MKTKDREAAIQRAEIAELIADAFKTLQRMPDAERRALQQAERGQAWPLIVHTAAEHAAWERRPSRRPPPTPAQITSMELVVSDWMVALAKQDLKFVKAVWLFCAQGLGPVQVGKILGCNRETATIWRDAGLDRIARHRSVKSIEARSLKGSLMEGMHHPMRRAG